MKTTPTLAAPKTLVQAIRLFSDPDVCLNHLIPIRWPDGITCPRCGSKEHHFIATRRIWRCKGECKKQFSVKIGTVMEESPLGLDKWLTGIWLIANAKNGISSYEAGRALGITQKSAWFLLHRIRLAMQSGLLTKVDGEVEVDETFIGGKARNMHADKRAEKIGGSGIVGKSVVLGVLDRETRKVHTHHIPDTKRVTIQPKIRAHVMAGSAVYTDAHQSYAGLTPEFVHEAVDHAVQYVRGNVHTNCLENYWSLLKRMLKGTYVSVEPFHLWRYLDEQAYRYNERRHADGTVKKDGERFVEVTGKIAGKRLTYKNLTCTGGNATELQA